MTEHMKTMGRPELTDLLVRAGVDLLPVSADRRILEPRHFDHGVEEFYSRRLNRRMIAAPSNGIDAHRHRELSAGGVPVLPGSDVNVEGLHLWDVPSGTYPLRSVLHAIAGNMNRYSVMLSQAKDVMRSLRNWQSEALPHDIAAGGRSMLDHLVVVQTPDGAGAGLVLAPPYRMAVDPATDPVEALRAELDQLDIFVPEHLEYVFQEA